MIGVWWAILMVVGCVKSPAPFSYVGDPEAVVAVARSRPQAEGLRARFSLKISTPGMGGTVPGSVMIAAPDRIRTEIYTPFGTPLLYLVSDGTFLHAWQNRDQIFYRGEQAGEVLANLTGGAVGIDDVIALLTARLPMVGAEILHTGRVDFDKGGVALELASPEEVTVRAVVDPATGMVVRLQVRAGERADVETEDDLIMDVQYEGRVKVGKVKLPKRVLISLPSMQWTIHLTIKSWAEFEPPDSVFELSVPTGGQEKDLIESIKEMSKDKRERP